MTPWMWDLYFALRLALHGLDVRVRLEERVAWHGDRIVWAVLIYEAPARPYVVSFPFDPDAARTLTDVHFTALAVAGMMRRFVVAWEDKPTEGSRWRNRFDGDVVTVTRVMERSPGGAIRRPLVEFAPDGEHISMYPAGHWPWHWLEDWPKNWERAS